PDLEYTSNGQGVCLIEGMVSPVQTGNADICGGIISYTWQFMDQCGNGIQHIQNITVEPAPPIAFINPPGNTTATCDNVPGNPGPLNFTNNGQGDCLIEGSASPVLSGSYDECGGAIAFTWQHTSQCGQT